MKIVAERNAGVGAFFEAFADKDMRHRVTLYNETVNSQADGRVDKIYCNGIIADIMNNVQQNTEEKQGFFSNAIAVSVFIIIMAIVIWGLLHIVNLSSSWFASTFSPRSSYTTSQTPAGGVMPTPVPTNVQQDTRTTTVDNPAPAYHTDTARGPADLAVRILSVSSGNPAVVMFDIANVGGSSSGSYTFTAYLPTADNYVYNSLVQYPLNPGDHVVNTLRFSQGVGGSVTIVVHAKDPNTANNTASQGLVGYYQPQYQYQYEQSYDYYGYPYGEYDYQYAYP